MPDRAERDQQVAAWTRDGIPARAIADLLHISDRTVYRIRTRLGVNVRPPARPLIAAELAQAAALLADGCPYAEVARTLARGETTIANHFPGHSRRDLRGFRYGL